MEQVHFESMGPAPAGTWMNMDGWQAGPGTFVAFVNSPLADGDTLQVQMLCNSWVVEDVTVTADDLTAISYELGFQSSPIPLMSNSWEMSMRARHTATSDKPVELRVIKL